MSILYLNKCARYTRNFIALIAVVVGGAGVTIWAALRGENQQMLSPILAIVSGVLLMLFGFFGLVWGQCADEQMKRAITEIKKQNDFMRRTTEELQIRNAENLKLATEMRANLNVSSSNNSDLAHRVSQLQNELVKAHELALLYHSQIESQKKAADEQIAQLEVLNFSSKAELEDLRALVVEQKTQIENLAEHARHLNELQRNSVKMIQQLALYGNQCEEFGQSLADVSKDLRETDDSLGLTAAEMNAQIIALRKISEALTRTDAAIRLSQNEDDAEDRVLLQTSSRRRKKQKK